MLTVTGERIAGKRDENEFDVVGRNVAANLRKMPSDMHVIAKNLINNVLYMRQIGLLKSSSKVITTPSNDNRVTVSNV